MSTQTATIPESDVVAASYAGPRSGSRPSPVLLGAIASIPLLVGAIVDAFNGWIPSGDQATILLRSRDVFSGHTPLVGQFSEISFYLRGQSAFSPGPMLYWVLAIPAQLTRWVPAAPLLWMAVVQSLVIIAIVSVAQRLGGHALALGTAIGLVGIAAGGGPRILYDPWSAYAPILPLVLLFFLAAAVVAGRHRWLPLVVLVASFEVQADPSFVVASGMLTLLALGAWLVAQWRERSVDRRTLGLTLGVAFVCWLPAIIQQFTTSPGNLTLIWRGTGMEGSREGLGFGLNILAKAVVALPATHGVVTKLKGGTPVSAIAVVGGLLILGGLAWLLVWTIRRAAIKNAAPLVAAALALAIAVVVAASAIPADNNGHAFWLLIWAYAAGKVLLVVVAWVAWKHWEAKLPARSLLAAATAAFVVAALGVAAFGRRPDPQAWAYPAIRRAAAAIERLPGRGPYAVSAQMYPQVPLGVGQGLIERLDARGYDVGANNGFEHNLGVHHRVPHGSTDVIVTGDPRADGVIPTPFLANQLVAVPSDLREYGHQVTVHVWLREWH